MMYWNGHADGGDWIVSVLSMVLVLGVVIGAILFVVWAVRNRRPPESTAGLPTAPIPAASSTMSTPTAPTPSAREILDARLARDELTVERYRELRAALSDDTPDPDLGREPSVGAGG